MNVPPWAGFVADFPEDEVATPGRIEVYGGRNVAVALGEIFARLGCSRVSDPESAGEQGWEFAFYEGRHRFWCRVQSFHPVFWLLFEDVSGTKKGASAYVELWRRFGNALERDPRFHKILWRPFKDGPPDWDEVEAAVDPPERTFEEQFPQTEISAATPKRGCLSALIGGFLIFWGAGWTIRGIIISDPRERWDDIHGGLPLLFFGLVVFYWSSIDYWTRKLRSRFADPQKQSG